MGTVYRQLLEELNRNGKTKTVTIVSDNESLGKKIIIASRFIDSINMDSSHIESILNENTNKNIINKNDYKLFESILKEMDLSKGTHIFKTNDEEVFVEELAGKPKLIICGGGHIALPLSKMGKMLEFHVTVIDSREEFANRDRFPHAHKVICKDFDEALEEVGINSNTYIVIVTRGHKDDRKCLEKVIRINNKYMGMIGSKGKVAYTFNLMREAGYTDDELNKVHSPVGLNIGAQTPEEIAVSIFAEIIQVKNEKLFCSIEESITDKLNRGKQDMVLATIVEKIGSSPRGAGAKMLVLEDGSFFGTVGGGSVENAVYEKSKELIKLKKSHVETYNLSNSKASTLGMACGGTVKVLFEYIEAVHN